MSQNCHESHQQRDKTERDFSPNLLSSSNRDNDSLSHEQMPPLHSLCLSSKPSFQAPLSTKPTAKPFPSHLRSLLPLPDQNLPLQFKEKILALEIMGVDSGRALSLNPTLQNTPISSIHSIISFLQSKGIHQKDMGRIFGMCPQILTSSIKQDLSPVFHFLSQDLKVPPTQFRKPINKCPRLLISSVRDQLKPALIFLQRLGLKGTEALAYNDPILLVSNVEKTLIPKLDCLMGFGFSRGEAVGMVVRSPALFTFSVERNLKPKFEYYVGKMSGSLEELKGFPQYFGFSLEKRIRPRYREMVERGMKGKVPLGLMLKATDDEFREVLEGG